MFASIQLTYWEPLVRPATCKDSACNGHRCHKLDLPSSGDLSPRGLGSLGLRLICLLICWGLFRPVTRRSLESREVMEEGAPPRGPPLRITVSAAFNRSNNKHRELFMFGSISTSSGVVEGVVTTKRRTMCPGDFPVQQIGESGSS